CLYRNMGVSRFVAFQDLDEFLIPQNPNSSSEVAPLLATLKTLFVKNVASIRVAARYMKITNLGELRTLRNTIRSRRLDTQLTKCVVRPEMIFEQGIHHTSRVIQNHYEIRDVNGTSLLLYHFKSFGGNVTDNRIPTDYGERLRLRYEKVLEECIRLLKEAELEFRTVFMVSRMYLQISQLFAKKIVQQLNFVGMIMSKTAKSLFKKMGTLPDKYSASYKEEIRDKKAGGGFLLLYEDSLPCYIHGTL
ncbi:hypothetical protein TELCIR_09875, partial [Teladorsagia circumcincta]